MKTLPAFLVAAACAACASTQGARDPRVAAVLPAARKADVVYFGEIHDDRRQHAFERDLLASLGGGDRPILLGMEMFQRPFQKPLDDYVAGAIDEKEMLRRTEYFTRWSFDFTFYAPLWRWCREHHARIVALNADAAVSHKVAGSGIDSLSPEERSSIAASIDLGNAAHRERIAEATAGHPMSPGGAEHMYEAMAVWDETMADTAAAALAAAGPRARMLVVAGRGHVEDFTGIPDRLARRAPGLSRVVVLGEESDAPAATVRKEDGQFVVSFPEDKAPPAPKLSVAFDAPVPDGLPVKTVVAGGAAAKAGLAAGDVLARLAGEPVRDLVDVRWVVDRAKTGDVVAAEAIRAGKRVPFRITLAPPPENPPDTAPKK